MTVWRLAIREICHRKLSLLMSVISVTTAIACLVGAQTRLRADRVITEHLLEKNRSEVEQALARGRQLIDRFGLSDRSQHVPAKLTSRLTQDLSGVLNPQEISQQVVPVFGEETFRMKLHTVNRVFFVLQSHHFE